MPYDDSVFTVTSPAIAPSAAIELSWLFANCHRDQVDLPVSADLLRRSDAFWGDGIELMIELLVLAQQRNCLTGWDVSPLFDLTSVTIPPPSMLTLETESPELQRLLRARLERMRGDAPLRKRYAKLLREIWTAVDPVWTSLGRPTVERAIARMQSSLDHGLNPSGLIPQRHIARKPGWAPLTQAAEHDGTLLVTPSYFAGGRGHIVALPGVLSVAIGAGVTADMAQRRVDAERIAGGLKLLSDPTRVLILGELDREPMTVGDTARCVGIAQPTASVHLRQMRDAGLLEAQREGSRTLYRVRRDRVQRVIDDARESLLEPLGQSAG
jgi:DNA-binding transcriptional ArsR family regulator